MKHATFSQRGFAAIEAILIIVAVAIIGGTGYYVYHANKKTNNTYNSATKTAQSSPSKVTKKKITAADPTANWTAYKSATGQFSLKYPASWVQPTNKAACGAGFFDRAVYLGPDTQSVLKCATEDFGQIQVASIAGNQVDVSKSKISPVLYKNIVSTSATAAGVSGTRIAALAINQTSDLGGYPDNTVIVEYVFYANGNTYVAKYAQVTVGSAPSSNVLADFDLMITKTLQFN
ncbi:MAG TPA: hypothetical protein VFC50_00255 [Candidatus Dormibacteraeota bacterium]|nr:hypothetical protein [Candidatus Dormibacteraeota bacterium]